MSEAYAKGQTLVYRREGQEDQLVTCVAVHRDEMPYYYTIKFPDGREKQTEHKNLSVYPSPPQTDHANFERAFSRDEMSRCLYVKGPPKQTLTEGNLRKLFGPYGRIESIHLRQRHIKTQDKQGKKRHKGFIVFSDLDEMENAKNCLTGENGKPNCKIENVLFKTIMTVNQYQLKKLEKKKKKQEARKIPFLQSDPILITSERIRNINICGSNGGRGGTTRKGNTTNGTSVNDCGSSKKGKSDKGSRW